MFNEIYEINQCVSSEIGIERVFRMGTRKWMNEETSKGAKI